MSPPVFFIGSTSSSVRRAVRERLCQYQQAYNLAPEDITIFNAGGGAERAWRKLLRNESQTTWLPRFAEFDAWCVDVVSLCSQQPRRWVNSTDRQFILRDVLPRLRTHLGSLRNLTRSHSFIRELDVLIADLRRAGVERVPCGGDWARDLQLIVDAYNGSLSDSGGTDIERAPRLLAQSCERYPRLPQCVVFDGIIHLPPSRWEGIQTVTQRVPQVVVSFVLPGMEAAPTSLDELLQQTHETVIHRAVPLWASICPNADLITCGEPDVRTNAVASLFDWRRPRAPQPEHVTLTEAHTARDELSGIAAHIRAHCSSPRDLESFTVVLPDPASYAGVLEPAFAEHGVPIRVLRARPHITYPVVRRLLSLFELSDSKWPADALTDIFGDGLFQLCSDGHTLDMHRLRNYCVKSRLSRLDELEQCADAFRSRLMSYDIAALEVAEHDLRCIRVLRASCEKVQGRMTVGQWAEAVYQLCELTTAHLQNAVDATAREATSQVELVYAAIDAVLRRFQRWLPDERRDARDFLDWLRLELENATEPLDDTPRAAVRIVGPLHVLSGVSGTVYCAGLNEGDWPGSHVPGTLVARHQHELAPIREHLPDPVQLAVHQLGICLTEADALHLSYANWREGRERLRSPLLEDLIVSWPSLPSLTPPEYSTSRTGLLAKLSAVDVDNFHAIGGIDTTYLKTLQRIQLERREDSKIGIYDGALDVDGVVGSTPVLDSTRLKAYAQCPLKYFFRYVLNLRSPETLVDDLQGHQSGSMVHKILERFGNEYSGPLNEAAAWEAVIEITQQEVERFGLRPVLREAELYRLLGRRGDEPGGVLGPVLHAEIEQRAGTAKKPAFARPLVPLRQSGLEPPPKLKESLEARFGMKLHNQGVRGQIDRIDVAPDYSVVAVIDYKTERAGGLADFDVIDAGLEFQLALYLLAAREIFSENGDRPALVAAYFSVRDARYLCGIGETGTLGRNNTKSGPGALAQLRSKELPTDQFDNWLDGVAERVGQIGQLIARGQFNLTLNPPEDAGCNFCDFATICRQDIGLQPRRHAAHVGRSDVYVLQPLNQEARDVE